MCSAIFINFSGQLLLNIKPFILAKNNILDEIFNLSLSRRKYRKGGYIFHQGETAKGVFRVVEGRVKLWKYNPLDNRSLAYYFYYPSDIFGVVDFLREDRICRCSATAMDSSVILQFVTYETFEKNLLSSPELKIEVIKTFIRLNELCVEKYFISQAYLLKERVFMAISGLLLLKGVNLASSLFLEHLT